MHRAVLTQMIERGVLITKEEEKEARAQQSKGKAEEKEKPKRRLKAAAGSQEKKWKQINIEINHPLDDYQEDSKINIDGNIIFEVGKIEYLEQEGENTSWVTRKIVDGIQEAGV